MTCAPNWIFFPHTGKCYQYVLAGYHISRTQSQAACANLSPADSRGSIIGELVSVPDATTYDFLMSLTGNKSAWLGGVRTENGKWSWPDGTAWNFTAWSHGEPNGQKYLCMNWGNIPGWFDFRDGGATPWGYICQYQKAGW